MTAAMLEGLDGFSAQRSVDGHVLLIVLQKVGKTELGGGPDRCLQAFANRLAVELDSAIVNTTADVLQQVRHFWERTPFCSLWTGARHVFRLSGKAELTAWRRCGIVNEIKVARVAELADALDSGSSE